MINEEDFLKFSKKLYRTFAAERKGVLSEIFGKQADDKLAQDDFATAKPPYNVTVTLTPEALLTILICVGGANNDDVQAANVEKAWRTKVKPASTVSLYSTLHAQARQAGIIK